MRHVDVLCWRYVDVLSDCDDYVVIHLGRSILSPEYCPSQDKGSSPIRPKPLDQAYHDAPENMLQACRQKAPGLAQIKIKLDYLSAGIRGSPQPANDVRLETPLHVLYRCFASVLSIHIAHLPSFDSLNLHSPNSQLEAMVCTTRSRFITK